MPKIPITTAPRAAIIWRGHSRLDGAPIVVVATTSSKNAKTGNMVQTWVLRADMLATDAVHSGADASICGDCRHRGDVVDGRNAKRTCYVRVFQAPRSVSAKVMRGGYPEADPRDMGRGRMVRLGSYGDPAAVPAHVWEALVSESTGWTGYTHQWRSYRARSLRTLCMASVDSEAERLEATAAGWRTFRVIPRGSDDTPRGPGFEIACPASKEAGAKTTCERCGLCRGATPEGRKRAIPSIAIRQH